jgi:hypothetical protein
MKNMKETVYIETSVVSYFTSNPSRDLIIAARQEITREKWPGILDPFEPYLLSISDEAEGYQCPTICSPEEKEKKWQFKQANK